MSEVIEHKPHNITLGVLDKSVQLFENLQSVTYKDHNGTVHTVHAHVNGPFSTPEDIVSAAEKGILHVFESHDAAIAHWADQEGGEEYVHVLEKYIAANKPQPATEGRGY